MIDTEQLIQQAKSGDLSAFEDLIAQYIPTIERFAFQCGVPFHHIDDVTQEVCIKLYRFLHQYEGGKFTTWLYQVTLNVVRDDYRKQQTMHTKIAHYQKEAAQQLYEKFNLDFDEDLHQAIIQLDDNYKMPIVLFYFHELTYKEIAKVLHISMPNVKLRLLRAKKKLKSILEGNL